MDNNETTKEQLKFDLLYKCGKDYLLKRMYNPVGLYKIEMAPNSRKELNPKLGGNWTSLGEAVKKISSIEQKEMNGEVEVLWSETGDHWQRSQNEKYKKVDHTANKEKYKAVFDRDIERDKNGDPALTSPINNSK